MAGDDLAQRLSGQILLQVESHGESWYVDPVTLERTYLEDGDAAYQALRDFGLGISTDDLNKLPVGVEERFADTDTDGDSLADTLEEGLGTDPNVADTDGDGYSDGSEVLETNTNPLGTGSIKYDASLNSTLRGRILLQVESRGEAWYLNPADGKRYYMKNGDAAYQIMRFLSLGITNADLSLIPEVGEDGNSTVTDPDQEYFLKVVGEEVVFTTIKFVINTISQELFLSGSAGFAYPVDANGNYDEDGRFIILNVDVTNISDNDVTLNADSFVLIEAGGDYKAYTVFDEVDGYGEDDITGKPIAPGEKESGVLVFQAPSLDVVAGYILPMDKLGTNETYDFVINNSGVICGEHPTWTEDQCDKVARGDVWIGMTYEMILVERGFADSENLSNYGDGDQWQWCWFDESPMCVYDDNDDGIVDSYN
ncbi:hypothetical protein A2348_03975 [Candidatus Uhrbacteria bacterium RIFOXYB12_FULL_58_10]|uniref:DUF4352 domain-containing protein n=1 Tax=Candidatus Uhrbacteria bacterium RIFOXYB2_FULL_57_15 TaxID=1802422 RepID=A0A1F7W6E0_9BACT|nr:MAG: hypothetical protein A2348_03975 [Candidatus Uhrbacteria bacterium RIFOXYB12_FULL_58_10]OGL97747.1 MAG: hypothetical protein A2304_00585 [Candidatus Uhrbacteria bacterium RIFOXYB2_FULL_57_15]OGL99609.1 MAG: hypothetical protein A2501_00175 [Candidatus Uhrbacteria bacterium RIFOXYC12_FULL_57_11]